LNLLLFLAMDSPGRLQQQEGRKNKEEDK